MNYIICEYYYTINLYMASLVSLALFRNLLAQLFLHQNNTSIVTWYTLPTYLHQEHYTEIYHWAYSKPNGWWYDLREKVDTNS